VVAVLDVVDVVVDGLVVADPWWRLLVAALDRREALGEPDRPTPVSATTMPAITNRASTPSAPSRRFDID
jgi:hypothetical protein